MTIESKLFNLCIDESPPRNEPLVAKYMRYFNFFLNIFGLSTYLSNFKINFHRSFAFPVLSKLTPFNISKTGSYLSANKNVILQKYGVVST